MWKKISLAMVSAFVVGMGISGCAGEDVDEEDRSVFQDDNDEALQRPPGVVPVRIEDEGGEQVTGSLEDAGEACSDEEACAEHVAEASDALMLPGCRTYYGVCTGFVYGTSCAQGEGWTYCASGQNRYAWMTICDGYGSYPSGYGVGYCWW